MRKWLAISVIVIAFSGCASMDEILGTKKLATPPEFNQKVILEVPDDYEMFQAPRSKPDMGDLEAFHIQHTLPMQIEDAFKRLFGEVEMVKPGEVKIEPGAPDVPAVFEVRILDIAHDIYNEATTYRSYVVLGVAMKSPRGNIFWQQAFRGDGYVRVDPQYSTGMGPEQAIVDALYNAIYDMQKAIIASPDVRAQMQYYRKIEQARREKEVPI